MSKIRCLTCKHIDIDFGEPGYSYLTPGYPGHWRCNKKVWNFDRCYADAVASVSEAFEIGETCNKYEERQGVKP